VCRSDARYVASSTAPSTLSGSAWWRQVQARHVSSLPVRERQQLRMRLPVLKVPHAEALRHMRTNTNGRDIGSAARASLR
jgi:hypothetical protein